MKSFWTKAIFIALVGAPGKVPGALGGIKFIPQRSDRDNSRSGQHCCSGRPGRVPGAPDGAGRLGQFRAPRTPKVNTVDFFIRDRFSGSVPLRSGSSAPDPLVWVISAFRKRAHPNPTSGLLERASLRLLVPRNCRVFPSRPPAYSSAVFVPRSSTFSLAASLAPRAIFRCGFRPSEPPRASFSSAGVLFRSASSLGRTACRPSR